MSEPQILIYKSDSGAQIKVSFKKETVWLTQKEISQLFDTTPQNITLHLKNIYFERELRKKATCKESLQVQIEGGRNVKRKQQIYNKVNAIVKSIGDLDDANLAENEIENLYVCYYYLCTKKSFS